MIPGLPVIWTGCNDRVAWASTHAPAAIVDLYRETLHATDPELYYDGGGWRPLQVRVESIPVRGGEEETLTVRSTRHGPLVHELFEPGREPLSLAWAGARIEEGSSVAALMAAARARDAEALLGGLARHREPPLTVVYADAQGSAGAQVAGWIPRRVLPSGLVPLPGRARWWDWIEPVAFEELPRAELARGQGWIIAADNHLASPEGGGRVEWLWQSGVRARRIDALLHSAAKSGRLDLRETLSIQTDVDAGRPRALIDSALELAVAGGDSLGSEAREVAELLRDWDGQEVAGSTGSAVYHVFLVSLTRALLQRHLEGALMERYLALPQADPGQVVFETVRAAAEGGEPGGWDDPELVGAAVRESLREAWLSLSFRLGANRRKWNWGRLNPLHFRPLGPPEKEGGALLPLGPFEVGGSGSTVNATTYDAAAPFAVRVAALFRFGVDAGALDQALTSLAPGQSEHPRHPHFGDGVDRWLEGRYRLLSTRVLAVEETSVSKLVLEPPR
jgi:penicillin amidase